MDPMGNGKDFTIFTVSSKTVESMTLHTQRAWRGDQPLNRCGVTGDQVGPRISITWYGCWTKNRGGFPTKWMEIMENPIKMDDLGEKNIIFGVQHPYIELEVECTIFCRAMVFWGVFKLMVKWSTTFFYQVHGFSMWMNSCWILGVPVP